MIADMLLEVSESALVPLNLLPMLLCCPAAVAVLVGASQAEPAAPEQSPDVGIDASRRSSGPGATPNEQAPLKDRRDSGTGARNSDAHEEVSRPDCLQVSPSISRVDDSHCDVAHRDLVQEAARGHHKQCCDTAEPPSSCNVPLRKAEACVKYPVPATQQGCDNGCQESGLEDRGVQQLGYALCGMLRAFRCNLLQPEVKPLLDIVGAIAREPGGGRWLQRCGISLSVVAGTLLQSSKNTGQQVQDDKTSDVSVQLAEVRAVSTF